MGVFYWFNAGVDDVAFVFGFFAILCVIFAIVLTQRAVNVFQGQSSHIHMLHREKIRLKYNGYDINKYENIFDEIVIDITKNVKFIRVFGIKMVPQFLSILNFLN